MRAPPLQALGTTIQCSLTSVYFPKFTVQRSAAQVCEGLREPDELQAFALRRVREIWGDVRWVWRARAHRDYTVSYQCV